jgi:xanthosine utilization system XapX-like protein
MQIRLRTIAITVAGFTVLIVGVALLVVPVPGTSVVIFPFGLAILAREFQWAQRLLDRSMAALRWLATGARRLFGRRPGMTT